MPNLFLFHGDNTYALQEKLNLWKKEFRKKYDDYNLETIEANELDLRSFIPNVLSTPLFADKRLIILKNFLASKKEEDKKTLAEKLDQIPETTVLVFQEETAPDKRLTLFKTLKKLATVEEFPVGDDNKTTSWLIQKAQKENLQISYSTAKYMLNMCGNNPWQLAQELNKLKSYIGDRELTPDDIDKLCTPSLSASIFQLTDQLSRKNLKSSLHSFKLLNDSGEDLGRTFFMLIRNFRIIIQVKDLVERGCSEKEIAGKLKQHPFVIQKGVQQSRNFTMQKLKEIYQDLLTLDTKVKTGIIKNQESDNKAYQLAIETFIIDCCK